MDRHPIAIHIDDFKIFPRFVTLFVLCVWLYIIGWFTDWGNADISKMKDWALVQFAAINGTFIGFSKLFLEAWKKE